MIMETAFADEINLWKDCTEARLRTHSLPISLYILIHYLQWALKLFFVQ